MATLKDWQYCRDGKQEGRLVDDFRKGFKNVHLVFTIEHQDPLQNEHVNLPLDFKFIEIHQQAEVLRDGDALGFSGKRRTRILCWTEDMKDFDDFMPLSMGPEAPEHVAALHKAAAEAKPVGPLPEGGGPLFDDYSHPTLEGCKTMAEATAKALVDAAVEGDIVGGGDVTLEEIRDDHNTGFEKVPFGYAGDASGKEAIDVLREEAGAFFAEAMRAGCSVDDAAFAAYCGTTRRKYELRLGRKGEASEDAEKVELYRAMFEHVLGRGPDPRAYREPTTERCCERDTDGDGNCDRHSAPGILRIDDLDGQRARHRVRAPARKLTATPSGDDNL